LVRRSYELPLETFAVNALGTASLLEAVRLTRLPAAIVVVTSDKCYEHVPSGEGYREYDPLGGHDPYSASKAAAEIIAASYRRSYFPQSRVTDHGVLLATARSGNVIGGGDWAADRIVPDAVRAFISRKTLEIRNPTAVRPWQHVLEPLSGYLWLAAKLADTGGSRYAEAWNFGPSNEQAISVRQLADALTNAWGVAGWAAHENSTTLHEADTLRLNIAKARSELGWCPVWDLPTAIGRTVDWYRQVLNCSYPDAALATCMSDIEAFEASAREDGAPWTN
jgi:CDP-glucose 4,6-dehydratase